MMGKATNVVTEPELKKLVTGLTGKGEEFYKAVDDFVANECEKETLGDGGRKMKRAIAMAMLALLIISACGCVDGE